MSEIQHQKSLSQPEDTITDPKAVAQPKNNDQADADLGLTEIKRPRVEAPWIILGALLLATILSAHQSNERARAVAKERFSATATAAAERIVDQVRRIDDAIVVSSSKLDEVRWNTFLENRDKTSPYPAGLVKLDYRMAAASGGYQGGSEKRVITLAPSLVRYFDASYVDIDSPRSECAN